MIDPANLSSSGVGFMRIVYVLTSLGMGGAERVALALAGRMAERGHTVALLVLRPPVAEQWPTDLHVVHLEMRRTPISVLAGMARARHFLGEFRPDLVHSHSFHANLVARLLKGRPPVVSTVHNVYEGGWLRMMAYRLTDGLACRTIAVSQAAADRFVRLKAVPQHKCLVLTNGIDTAEFAPSTERRGRTRADMGANAQFIWLTAGRIVPAKDFPNLLRAFARVRAARPETQLWVAGEASDSEFSMVQRLAEELSLEASVRWLGLRRDLPALLDAADGFVLGSAWEGMPLVVGEAMAMEKPVVATDVGGVRELVGDAGVIVPAKDSDRLAEAMLNLMERAPRDRQTLGLAARVRIASNFSMDAKANEWEALYTTILKRSG
jgi:glycosyltransferase involved in cell wall biosynthesis